MLNESKNYTRFVIIGQARTGSNFLVSLLNSHPSVVTFGEILGHADFIPWNADAHAPIDKKSTTHIAFRNSKPIAFLNNYIYKVYEDSIKAVGFKLFYYHARTPDLYKVWTFLKNHKHIKIIHIKRLNLLRVYASLQIAFKTDEWLKTNTTPNQQNKIELGYQDCVAFFERSVKQKKEALWSISSHETLDVIYEDLVNNTENTLSIIQDFLGIERQPLQSNLQKQNPEPLTDLVTNYAELKASFQGSEWAHFFED